MSNLTNSGNAQSCYAYVSGWIAWEAPWHARNWDKNALRGRLEAAPGISNVQITLVKSQESLWQFDAAPKKAHVWFNSSLQKADIRTNLVSAADTHATAGVQARNIQFGVEPGTLPEAQGPNWLVAGGLVGAGFVGAALLDALFD